MGVSSPNATSRTVTDESNGAASYAPAGRGKRAGKGAGPFNIARARELLAASKPEGQPTAAAVDSSKPACPCCGGRMIIIEVFARGATPRHQPTAPTSRIRIDTS